MTSSSLPDKVHRQPWRLTPQERNTVTCLESPDDGMLCQRTVYLGFFFDGTGNHLHYDKAKQAHSHVARLYEAFDEGSRCPRPPRIAAALNRTRHTRHTRHTRRVRMLGVMLVLPLLLACTPVAPPPTPPADDGMVPLQISILNYTDHYIGVVYVNGTWAGNMVAHSGGGSFAGSAEVPRHWDPNYRLTIQWQDEALYEKDPDGLFTREVATEPYQQDEEGRMATLWVAFFPDDVIKLYPAFAGPGHPDFPGGLLAPKLQCRKERPGTDWCERSGWIKRHAEQQRAKSPEDATP